MLLILGGDLELFEFAVGHFKGPDAQGLLGEFDGVAAHLHAAPQRLAHLDKFFRRTERAEVSGEIL